MPGIDQRVYQRSTAEVVGRSNDVQYTLHPFTCQPGLGSSETVHRDLVAFLEARGYGEDWVAEFELAAEEALSDACEHAPPATEVRGFILVISHNGVDHVSVSVSNQVVPGTLENLNYLDQLYDCHEHLSDTRGHGFPIMRSLVDGMVVSLVVDRMFQNVLEKDYLPAKK